MELRALAPGAFNACADFNGFYGLNAHKAMGDRCIQLAVVMDMAAEPDRYIVGSYLKNSA